MLKLCFVLWKSEPQYSYKRYAYKKYVLPKKVETLNNRIHDFIFYFLS